MAKTTAMKAMKVNAMKKAPSSPMKAMKGILKNQQQKPSPMKSSNPMKSVKTTKNTKNEKELSLDEKIALWREKNKDKGKNAEEPELSMEEWSKVNGRFKTAVNKNPDAKETWESASNLSRGQGVQKAKRQAMVAWLMDPSFGKGFQEYCQAVTFSQSHRTVEKPETWKQLSERYEDEEIEAMIDAWIHFNSLFLNKME